MVEDNSEVRAVSKRILESAGYAVWEAADGTEGIASRLVAEKRGLAVVVAHRELVAIDGTFIKAVNSPARSFTKSKLKKLLNGIETATTSTSRGSPMRQ